MDLSCVDSESVVPNFPLQQLATEKDVAHLNLPNQVHPPTSYEFECPPILIENEEGLPPIDIMDAFRKYSFASRMKLADKDDIDGVPLPASVYEPVWDQIESVRQPILLAARKVGIDLICKTLYKSRNHFILSCTHNSISNSLKQKVEDYEKSDTRENAFGVPLSQFCGDYRQDSIINQKARNRKSKT